MLIIASVLMVIVQALVANPLGPLGYIAMLDGCMDTDACCDKLHSEWLSRARDREVMGRGKPKVRAAIESYRARRQFLEPKMILFNCRETYRTPFEGPRCTTDWVLPCDYASDVSIVDTQSIWNAGPIQKGFCSPPRNNPRKEKVQKIVQAGTSDCVNLADLHITKEEVVAWTKQLREENLVKAALLGWYIYPGNTVKEATDVSSLRLTGLQYGKMYRACAHVASGSETLLLSASFYGISD